MDEEVQPVVEDPQPEVEQPQPVDEEMQTVDPHPVDEDPEEHIGDAMLDPWTDKDQTDWPNNEEDVD